MTTAEAAPTTGLTERDKLADLPRWLQGLVTVIALGMVAFQLWIAATRPLDYLPQRTLHLGFVMTLLFLLNPARPGVRKPLARSLDYVLAAVGGAIAIYPYFIATTLHERAGLARGWEQAMGLVLVLLVLEGCRRVVGWEVPVITGVFILYMFFGQWSPILPHPNFSLREISFLMYLSSEGIFASPLGVSSTILVVFLILAAFLRETGAAQFLIDISNSLLGHVRGGPAKVATVASGLFGTMSGSALSNVVTTGTFTIPLMKSVGYRPAFAAATEAAASTGGLIMPPVMGTAAFLMAEFMRVPYGTIATMAIIPALLYYASIYFTLDLEARRLNLRGVAERPRLGKVFLGGWHYLPPLAVLVYLLMVMEWNPMKAAFWGLITAVGVTLLRGDLGFFRWRIWRALRQGALDTVEVAVVCAAAGIITGVVSVTGLGIKLSTFLLSAAGGNLLLLLVMAMLAALALGMGLDSASTYIVLAILVAPALTDMGVFKPAAHFFLFYFGITAGISPPVAITAYAAAGIARADPNEAGWLSFRMVIPSFLVAYMFVYNPVLLGVGTPLAIGSALVTSLTGVAAMSAATVGFVRGNAIWWERLLWFGGGAALVAPGLWTDLAGFGVLALSLALHWRRTAARPAGTATLEGGRAGG